MQGTMSWTNRGTKTGQINFAVSTQRGNEHLHLKYKFRKEQRDYKSK